MKGANLDSMHLKPFQESAQLAQAVLKDEGLLLAMAEGANLLIQTLESGNKIMACGNGGSMCDAMHFAEELSGRYRENRKPFAAMSLSDPSALTCIGNDFGFDQVFARQVEALGQPGDVLLAISTSGNSGNILEAAKVAKDNGMHVLGLTGNDGEKLQELSSVEVRLLGRGRRPHSRGAHSMHSCVD